MKKLVCIVLAGIALVSCSRGRIIPDGKLENIYYEMFLADQWMKYTPGMEKKADTMLFYEPVFRKYGYTFKDYDATVSHKLKNCEDYSKLLKRVSERLRAGADALQSLIEEREKARQEMLKAKPYLRQDFGYPFWKSDVYENYYEKFKNLQQYGFAEKVQLFAE